MKVSKTGKYFPLIGHEYKLPRSHKMTYGIVTSTSNTYKQDELEVKVKCTVSSDHLTNTTS